ncbi:MAG: hypothetical protein WJU30_00394 [Candidatus Phytoplasma pruni]
MNFILKHEIPKPQKYIAILQSIAYGATKLNDISKKAITNPLVLPLIILVHWKRWE